MQDKKTITKKELFSLFNIAYKMLYHSCDEFEGRRKVQRGLPRKWYLWVMEYWDEQLLEDKEKWR